MEVGGYHLEDGTSIAFFILFILKTTCEVAVMVWIISRICRESKDKYVDVIKITQYSILFLLSLNDVSINIISIWIEMSSTFISTVGNILVSMVLYIPLTQLSWLIMLKHMNSTRLSLNKVDYKYIKRMIKIYEIKLILVIILFYFLFISIITVSYYLMVQHGIQNTVGKFMFYSQIAVIYLIFAVSGVIIQRKITITHILERYKFNSVF